MSSLRQRKQQDPADYTDRRSQARAKAVLAYGKIACSGVEQICQVRDISARGIRIEARNMPQPGQRVWIEMRGLAACPAVVVWREGNAGGLAFENEQDLQTMFDLRLGKSAEKPRGPRFSLRVAAELSCREGVARLEVIDISMGGLKLAGATDLGVGAQCIVKIDGLAEELSGHVRWKDGEMLGFRFDRPMLRDDLYDILCCRG